MTGLGESSGERLPLDQALERLRTGLAICSEMNMLPQWWAHRIAIHVLSDLWSSTFHENYHPVWEQAYSELLAWIASGEVALIRSQALFTLPPIVGVGSVHFIAPPENEMRRFLDGVLQ